MNKVTVLIAMLMIVLSAGLSNASLTTIGYATIDEGEDQYNLIYEDNSIDGGLVWLDYTKSDATWQDQVVWASGLGGSLDVTLVGYWTTIDLTSGWRLPLTQEQTAGYPQEGSEMGHLYYVSMGNEPNVYGSPSIVDYEPFQNITADDYWSATEYDDTEAWFFYMSSGYQEYYDKTYQYTAAIAVNPGEVYEVSAVPIPSAVWLLGSGLIGIVGISRKIRK